jgi:hypothetical protein
MSNIEQNNSGGPTVIGRGTGKHKRFAVQAPKFAAIAANDNDCERGRPLIPLPVGHLGIQCGQQELNQPLSTDRVYPSLLSEEVTTTETVQATFSPSWRARFGRTAYVATISIAMFGWLYLLWLGLISSMQAILN